MFRITKKSGLCLLAAALLLTAAGCSGRMASPAPEPNDAPFSLPTLDSVAASLAQRETSYAKSELLVSGDEYDILLPHQLAAASAQFGEAVLSPNYPKNAGSAAGLAYCMYRFKLPGYDLNAEVSAIWGAPLDSSWLALANWSSGRWDILPAQQDGHYMLPSLSPYFDAQANLVVAMIATGIADSKISEVRIGSEPPYGTLTADIYSGPAPLSINFKLDNVYDLDGTVKKIEWDLDGDGSYEISAGLSQAESHTYPAAGDFMVKARLTDNEGASSVQKVGVTVGEGWAHSYGVYGFDNFTAIAGGPQGSIYAAGSSMNSSSDGILARLNADGSPAWVSNWDGGQSDSYRSIAVDAAGAVFAAGRTEDPQLGTEDALIQKYNSNGSLAWSKALGGPQQEIATAAAVCEGDVVVCGYAQASSAREAFVVRLSGSDGSLVWERHYNSFGEDEAYALAVREGPGGVIAVGGNYYTDYGDCNVLGLVFDLNGSLLADRRFGDGSSPEGCSGICLDDNRIYFLCNLILDSGDYTMLMATDFGLGQAYVNGINRAEDSYQTGLSLGNGALWACGYGLKNGFAFKLDPADGSLLKAFELKNSGSLRTSLGAVLPTTNGLLFSGEAGFVGKPQWLAVSPQEGQSQSLAPFTAGVATTSQFLPLADRPGSLSPGSGSWDQSDDLGEAFVLLRPLF